MSTFKISLFFVLAIFFAPLTSNAQCDVKIEYSHKKNSENLCSIFLNAEEPSTLNNVTVKLYDLYLGKIIDEKKVVLTNEKTEVFKNVKPSLYTIYVETDRCEKPLSLGGINGIKIGDF